MAKSISEALGCEHEEADMESPIKKKKRMGMVIVIPISRALMERDEPSAEEEE